MLSIPTGATHFRFIAGGAEVDFNTGRYTVMTAITGYLPVDTATAALTLELPVTAKTVLPLFLVLGIESQQAVNGQYLPLRWLWLG